MYMPLALQEAREKERQKLLGNIQRKATMIAATNGGTDFLRALLYSLMGYLATKRAGFSLNEMPYVPFETRQLALEFFCDIRLAVENFQATEQEGEKIIAELFILTARDIAGPHLHSP